jgi:hypothetical protein
MFAIEFGTGQVLWSILWFFLFFLWIWLLITIFADIIRAKDMSGWAKAAWTILIIFLPLIGVLLYLIVNGDKMGERAAQQAAAQERAFRSYVQEAAGTGGGTGGTSAADQLEKLAALHTDGKIDDAEYQQLKAKILAS